MLDTQIKRGAELSTCLHLVMNWIWWQGRKPDGLGRPKRGVRVCWERLAEDPVRMLFNSHLWRIFNHIPDVAGSMESEWAMFHMSRSLVLVVVVPPGPAGETYRSWLSCGTLEAVNSYRQTKQCAAWAVTEPKTPVCEEFGEAMEQVFQSTPKKFWQIIQQLRRGKRNPPTRKTVDGPQLSL